MDAAVPRLDAGGTAQRIVCGAKRRNGTPCGKWACKGKRRCRLHGGVGDGGPIKHGRYSKHLGRIREAYQAALEDRTLLDLREPIAALDAIVRRLAERVEEHDTPGFRARLLELLAESSSGSEEEQRAARAALYDTIQRGATEDEALRELRESLSELAKRIEGAWKVKLDKKHALGAAETRVLVARFLDLVAAETSMDVARRVGARLRGELEIQRN